MHAYFFPPDQPKLATFLTRTGVLYCIEHSHENICTIALITVHYLCIISSSYSQPPRATLMHRGHKFGDRRYDDKACRNKWDTSGVFNYFHGILLEHIVFIFIQRADILLWETLKGQCIRYDG